MVEWLDDHLMAYQDCLYRGDTVVLSLPCGNGELIVWVWIFRDILVEPIVRDLVTCSS